jgi:hypothetical protein
MNWADCILSKFVKLLCRSFSVFMQIQTSHFLKIFDLIILAVSFIWDSHIKIMLMQHTKFQWSFYSLIQINICSNILLLLNSYSVWHCHQTIHARETICRCREENPRREKKNLSSLNLLLRRSSSISRHWLVAATFVRFLCCYFLYQLQKIACAINQTSM